MPKRAIIGLKMAKNGQKWTFPKKIVRGTCSTIRTDQNVLFKVWIDAFPANLQHTLSGRSKPSRSFEFVSSDSCYIYM